MSYNGGGDYHHYSSSSGNYSHGNARYEQEEDRGRWSSSKRGHSPSRRSNSRERKKWDRGDRSGHRDFDRGNSSGYEQQQYQQPQQWQYEQHHEQQAYGGGSFSKGVEPVSTIIIKGLPSHTTESTLMAVLGPFYPKEMRVVAQRGGECKGLAFVDFMTVDHAKFFMTAFAGSCGDPKAPQFIVDNRAVQLDYARDGMERPQRHGANKVKSDWLCEACNCHNFGKRDICFRCNQPKTDRAILITASNEPFGDSAVTSDFATSALVVRGFPAYATDDQLKEIFRAYAVVKDARIIRDPITMASKGLAFVQFHGPEHASYTLQCSHGLQMEGSPLRTAFAKENVMLQMLNQMANASITPVPPPAMPMAAFSHANPLIASAMQAAQWSLNNGYSGTSATAASSALPLAQTGFAAPHLAKPVWPPLFETNGGAYLFQTKSGYFLEPISEFYYCPKSKLYYSARDGGYYYHDATRDPPFRRHCPPLPIEPQDVPVSAPSAVPDVPAALVEEAPVHKPVQMSLGKAKGAKAGAAPAKKVLQDMAKWQAAAQDLEEDEANVNEAFGRRGPRPPAAPVVHAPTVAPAAPTSAPPVAISAPAAVPEASAPAGKAICNLCRRQFPSAEMLTRHEKESKLHAENLAKAQAAGPPPPAPPAVPQYRDRASERREQFGSVADHVILHVPEEANMPRPPPPPAPGPPVSVAADISNPGNHLLRKMGWKDGQGLGANNDGAVQAVGVSASHAHVSSVKSSISYTDPAQYKESILAATRARYEQVSKQSGMQ